MKLTLRRKVITLVLFAALVPLLVTQFAVFQFKGAFSERTESELDTLGREALKQIVYDMYSLCITSNDLIQDKVDRAQKVAWSVLNETGGIKFAAEKVEWSATDQYSKKKHLCHLPKMLISGKWQGQSPSFNTPMAVVDEVKELLGVATTIFQRMNETGDMLRVATNVATVNQQRAIGTYIPAIRPDGTKDVMNPSLMKTTILSASCMLVKNLNPFLPFAVISRM
ncbi:MAG: Cache 3/Cache 2 fusion domain-containing protein [Ignavibacteriales bacterium]|nr:Cache 3/Cache 2 fusion domain-containing protein [Ignavibacteriales bacterium]